MEWFYVENGQQAGPVSDNQLLDMVNTGRIKQNTMVWHEGMANWTEYNKLPQKPQPTAATTAPAAATATADTQTCYECGRLFPFNDLIQYENVYVCAECKPVFLKSAS